MKWEKENKGNMYVCIWLYQIPNQTEQKLTEKPTTTKKNERKKKKKKRNILTKHSIIIILTVYWKMRIV